MDYNSLIKVLVRHLRGSESQSNLSQKIGYSYNQVHRWEVGKVKIAWEDFVRFSEQLDIDLLGIFNRINVYCQDLRPQTIVSCLFNCFNDDIVCKEMNFNRFQLQRLKTGNKVLTLNILFRGLDVLHRVLYEFIDEFININDKNIQSILEKDHLQRDIFFGPLVGALAIYFKLDVYKKQKEHNSEFIAKTFNTTVDKINNAISILENMEKIVYKRNKYIINPKYDPNASYLGEKENLQQFLVQHCQLAKDKASKNNFNDIKSNFNCVTFPVNNTIEKKVRELTIKFWKEMLYIVDDPELVKEESINRIQVVQLNLLDVTDHFPDQ